MRGSLGRPPFAGGRPLEFHDARAGGYAEQSGAISVGSSSGAASFAHRDQGRGNRQPAGPNHRLDPDDQRQAHPSPASQALRHLHTVNNRWRKRQQIVMSHVMTPQTRAKRHTDAAKRETLPTGVAWKRPLVILGAQISDPPPGGPMQKGVAWKGPPRAIRFPTPVPADGPMQFEDTIFPGGPGPPISEGTRFLQASPTRAGRYF